MSLPSIIVEQHIYPYAVRVIEDRDQLIKAVDEYYSSSGSDERQFPIGQWDVEHVTDFSNVFDVGRCNLELENFNDDISSWNVANGTTFQEMFVGCESFSSDLSDWDVANATNLKEMFRRCGSFNCNLSAWNVANATNMSSMFGHCSRLILMCRDGMWQMPPA